MKPRFILVLIIVLMAALSSQAFATSYFGLNDLVEVVYNPTGTAERAIDLGNLTTLNLGAITSPQLLTSGVTLPSPSDLGAGSNWSNLSVGFFSFSGTTAQVGSANANNYFVASTLSTAPGAVVGNAGTFRTAYNAIAGTTGTYVGTNQSVKLSPNTTNPNTGAPIVSYLNQMDAGGPSAGTYTSLIPAATGEGSIAAGQTSLTMYLYEYHITAGVATLVKNAAGTTDYMGKLILDTTGNTTAVPTPIPASLLLFGSGLLGLVGLRRKSADIAA